MEKPIIKKTIFKKPKVFKIIGALEINLPFIAYPELVFDKSTNFLENQNFEEGFYFLNVRSRSIELYPINVFFFTYLCKKKGHLVMVDYTRLFFNISNAIPIIKKRIEEKQKKTLKK